MRILRIADVPNNRSGGMSRYIHLVTDELRAQGHTVDLLFSDDLSVKWNGRLRRFAVPLRVCEVAKQYYRDNQYDVVEIHEPIAAAYAWQRQRSRALPPLLVSVYALEARSLAARISYAQLKQRPLRWTSRFGALSIVWQANYAVRRADQIVVETNDDAEHLTKTLGISNDSISLQHGGVSAAFQATPAQPRQGILFVGTWIERKGIYDLAPALTKVLEQHPDIRVTIAGSGCPVEHVLTDFRSDVRPRIQVYPSIQDEVRLAQLYREHAIFAFPSIFEGLPLVLLEAAAAGMAIVTTPVCGMKDFIIHNQNGRFVEVGDSEGLARSVLELLQQPAEAARLGAAAQASSESYTWSNSAEQFLQAAELAAGHCQLTVA